MYIIPSLFACEDTEAITIPTTKIGMSKPPEAPADAPGLTEEGMGVSKTKRVTDKAINKLYQLYLTGDVDPEVFATQLAGWLGYWVQDDPHLQISYAFLIEFVDKIVGGELGPIITFAKTIQRKFIGHCLNFHPLNVIESKVRLESMPLLKWVDWIDYEICLALLDGKKLRDIAQSIRMTQDAIRRRVQRMREKRKKFLQQGTPKINLVLASPVGGRAITVENSGNPGAGNIGKQE